jgi:hypothetical protein
MPAAAFLALSQDDSPMLLYMIIGGVMALGPVVLSYIKVYDRFMGKAVDTSVFVTRAEFHQAKAERDAQLAGTVTEIRADLNRVETLMENLNRDLPGIHRALGRLEGHDDATLKRPR